MSHFLPNRKFCFSIRVHLYQCGCSYCLSELLPYYVAYCVCVYGQPLGYMPSSLEHGGTDASSLYYRDVRDGLLVPPPLTQTFGMPGPDSLLPPVPIAINGQSVTLPSQPAPSRPTRKGYVTEWVYSKCVHMHCVHVTFFIASLNVKIRYRV